MGDFNNSIFIGDVSQFWKENSMTSANRRKLTKAERLEVYQKTGGHCAYCGCKLDFDAMQVDHVVPLNGWNEQGEDAMDNMLPACRSCNHYKSRSTLEGFRRMLEAMPDVLMRDSVTYKNAVRFGLVKPQPHPVTFYFERLRVMDNGNHEP